MDDRIFQLVVGIIVSTVLVTVLAGLARFELDSAFYSIPGAVIALLIAITNRREGPPPPPPDPPAPESGNDLEEARRAIRKYLDEEGRR